MKITLTLLLLVVLNNQAIASFRKEPILNDSLEAYFSLNEVRLLESPFLSLQQKGKEYLLWLNPDSLLHFYRIEAGLPSKAAPYAG